MIVKQAAGKHIFIKSDILKLESLKFNIFNHEKKIAVDFEITIRVVKLLSIQT